MENAGHLRGSFFHLTHFVDVFPERDPEKAFEVVDEMGLVVITAFLGAESAVFFITDRVDHFFPSEGEDVGRGADADVFFEIAQQRTGGDRKSFGDRFGDVGGEIGYVCVDEMDDLSGDPVGFRIEGPIGHCLDPCYGTVVWGIVGEVYTHCRARRDLVDHRCDRDIGQFVHSVAAEADDGQCFTGVFENNVDFRGMGKFSADDVIVEHKLTVVDREVYFGAILIENDMFVK